MSSNIVFVYCSDRSHNFCHSGYSRENVVFWQFLFIYFSSLLLAGLFVVLAKDHSKSSLAGIPLSRADARDPAGPRKKVQKNSKYVFSEVALFTVFDGVLLRKCKRIPIPCIEFDNSFITSGTNYRLYNEPFYNLLHDKWRCIQYTWNNFQLRPRSMKFTTVSYFSSVSNGQHCTINTFFCDLVAACLF